MTSAQLLIPIIKSLTCDGLKTKQNISEYTCVIARITNNALQKHMVCHYSPLGAGFDELNKNGCQVAHLSIEWHYLNG